VEEVKRAYREAAKRLHPDHNSGPAGEERFSQVVEAYQALLDPERRAALDEALAGAEKGDDRGAASFERVAPGLVEGVTRVVGGVLEQVKEGVARRWSLGKDLRYTLPLSFGEALIGCEKRVEFDAPVRCVACKGRGRVEDEAGRVVCARCIGHGVVVASRRFSLEIPPGTSSGQLTRIPKGGVPGLRGGPEGDLTFIVEVVPHPYLTKEGDDLCCLVPLPATTAIGGGRLRVPTLEGSTVIEIPSGVQTGQVFRLAGRGAPAPGGRRGDLKVTVEVEAPRTMPEAVRRLLLEAERADPAAVFPRSTALRLSLEGKDE
jgi:molecular chaperone DnaJ